MKARTHSKDMSQYYNTTRLRMYGREYLAVFLQSEQSMSHTTNTNCQQRQAYPTAIRSTAAITV
jgi:hypothetical protein